MSEQKIFINFTNHPSDRWREEQISAAKEYGEIIDIPFPSVNPWEDRDYILKLAEEYTEQIMQTRPAAVLCQGEFCMVYQMVLRLKNKGIKVLSACSERTEGRKSEKGGKEELFGFCQFREY